MHEKRYSNRNILKIKNCKEPFRDLKSVITLYQTVRITICYKNFAEPFIIID